MSSVVTVGILFVSSSVKTLAKKTFKVFGLASLLTAKSQFSVFKGLMPIFDFVLAWTYFQKYLGFDLHSLESRLL